jgi:hypothetical protein
MAGGWPIITEAAPSLSLATVEPLPGYTGRLPVRPNLGMGARMKAEHRKELQTNALADRIGRFFKGIKTKTQSNSLKIWVVVILLVVGVGGAWLYFSAAARNNRSERWVAMDRAVDAERQVHSGVLGFISPDAVKKAEKDLNALIKKYPGTETALMARFQLADLHLRVLGLDQLGETRADSAPLENLETAAKEYDDLADDDACKGDPFWEPQALLGVAKATEARAIKDLGYLKRAARQYEELAKKFPKSAAGKEAADISKKLKDPEQYDQVKKCYEDLHRRWYFDRK